MTQTRKTRKKSARPAADGTFATPGSQPAAAPGAQMDLHGPFSRTTLRARLALLSVGGQTPRLSRP